MSRVKRGVRTRARHKKIIVQASGYRGIRKKCYRSAKDAVEKSLQYSYRDRRTKKRDFRRLWIQRINAAARLYGIPYSQFIAGLLKAKIEINRKILADLAVSQPDVFKAIAIQAKNALFK